VRKRLFGLTPEERAGAAPGRGIYTPEHTERTYTALLERAEPVLRSGRTAILDATFAARRRREDARSFARGLGARACFVETRCAREEALRRLARREAEGRDPSDAGPALYARSVEGFEPPTEWPQAERSAVETDHAAWLEEVRELAARLR
jgi:predicted kinase